MLTHQKIRGYVGLTLLAMLASKSVAVPSSLPDTIKKQTITARRDSFMPHRIHEDVRTLRGHLLTSTHPVTIRQQGRQLCVNSSYRQLLPVYKADGTFFSAFRLFQGSNWLTGLPRGSYYINNQRYTIQ